MKKICMAACLAASLGICSLAMAKDIDGVDVFAGNSLSAIVNMDVPSIANNQLVYDIISMLDGELMVAPWFYHRRRPAERQTRSALR